jgi:hypothetical protein
MEIISNQLNEQGLRDYFGRLEFDSMIKEKTWQKYIKTFKEVTNESSAI